MSRITIIDGHPDAEHRHFVHALADSYAEGAAAAGHDIRRVNIGALDFPIIRSQAEWKESAVPPAISDAQEAVSWAEHLVFLYPLWLGDVPALFKGFLEQVARPQFAFRYREKGLPEKLLTGRSARVIVTMGMPGFVYRLVYRGHSLKSLERNILAFVGIGPLRHTIIGRIESSDDYRRRWLDRVRELGSRAG